MLNSAVPFGLVGAVFGHAILGMTMNFLSMMGMVAVAGVVVNDSLVLVHFINRTRKTSESLTAAVRDAGTARFRPILLTSLTTAAGVTPLMLEKSIQAQFLIPMRPATTPGGATAPARSNATAASGSTTTWSTHPSRPVSSPWRSTERNARTPTPPTTPP